MLICPVLNTLAFKQSSLDFFASQIGTTIANMSDSQFNLLSYSFELFCLSLLDIIGKCTINRMQKKLILDFSSP